MIFFKVLVDALYLKYLLGHLPTIFEFSPFLWHTLYQLTFMSSPLIWLIILYVGYSAVKKHGLNVAGAALAGLLALMIAETLSYIITWEMGRLLEPLMQPAGNGASVGMIISVVFEAVIIKAIIIGAILGAIGGFIAKKTAR